MSLEYAIEQCKKIPYVRKQSRHYCVITTKRGKIVAEASNDYRRTHPKQARAAKKAGRPEACYLHSEILALIRSRGVGEKMFIVRLDSENNAVYSAPCEICSAYIKEAGHIKSVEYTI
jgi:deoxycytidylate deaminase